MLAAYSRNIVKAPVFSIVVLAHCLSVGGAIAQEKSRPNIVLIYTDDMGPEHLGCYGGRVLTPHLDKLAEQGALLTRYYTCSSVCSPSRYNLLTGRYASRCVDLQHQYPDLTEPAEIMWNTVLNGGELTIADLLGDVGYSTGFFGKHHNSFNGKLQTPQPHGADPNSDLEKTRMRRNNDRMVAEVQRTTGFRTVDRLYANNLHVLDIDSSLQHHNPEWITAGAIDYIDHHKQEPFFLYMAMTLPHGPSPLESLKVDPRITPLGLLEEAPDCQPSREDVKRRVSEEGYPEHVAPMTWVDDSIGAVLAKLESEGLTENTIVLVLSDHSGKGKLTCYEDGVRTTALIRWPGRIAAGSRIDGMIANIDVAPMLLKAGGVSVPQDYVIDGVDPTPVLEGKQASTRESVLVEIAYTKGVVTRDWKYIATRFPSEIRLKITPENRTNFNHEGVQSIHDHYKGEAAVRYGTDEHHPGIFDDEQLYSLVDDPKEKHNLAYDEKYARQLMQMHLLLKAHAHSFPHRFGEY